MEITSMAALFGGLNQALQMGKSLLGMTITAEVRTQVGAMMEQLHEAKSQLFEVKAAHLAALDRIQALEKELARRNAFAEEKVRYRFKEIGPNVYAYELEQSGSPDEPVHALCCHCYDEGFKSILQAVKTEYNVRVLRCQRCGSELRVPDPSQNNAPVIVAFERDDRFDGWT